ncbi:MAG: hypothetical protein KC468_24830, partial [Myxococcales bacterium]|nr:hypothetical protein [Myxococcales bacterium]
MPEDEQQGQQAQDADRIKSWTRLQRLFSYTKPYRLRLAVAIVCLVGASGLGLVYPYFFGELANSAFANASLGPDEIEAARVTLTRSTLVLVAVFLGQSVFIFFRHYLMTWLGERVVADLRVELYRHLAGMPQSYFHTTRTGELLSRLGDDVTRLQDTVGQDLSMALRNLLTLTGGIVILLVTNTRLTLTMLAVVPALVIAAGIWSRVIRRLSREAQDALAKANGELQEGISAIETVQAFTREEHEVQRYGGAIERTFGLFIARALARSWFSAVISFLFFSAVAGIFWLGGSMVLDQSISVGEFTSFIFYTMMVAAAVG